MGHKKDVFWILKDKEVLEWLEHVSGYGMSRRSKDTRKQDDRSKLFHIFHPFLVAQLVNDLPAMPETQVQFLGQEEDPLEKEVATHSNTLSW